MYKNIVFIYIIICIYLILEILKDTELTIKTIRGKTLDMRFEDIKTYSNKLQVFTYNTHKHNIKYIINDLQDKYF